jgi:hypothetical protein
MPVEAGPPNGDSDGGVPAWWFCQISANNFWHIHRIPAEVFPESAHCASSLNTPISEEFEMHQDLSPNPISADTAEFNAADLHASSQLGERANPYILDRMGEYNTNFKDEPKKLQEIAHIYKQLSKNDPVFANEVQIAADGSLNFYPSKVTSPQLRKLEDNLIADSMLVLHDRQNNMFESDDADRVLKDIAALQNEEKRLVPTPKNAADTNKAQAQIPKCSTSSAGSMFTISMI